MSKVVLIGLLSMMGLFANEAVIQEVKVKKDNGSYTFAVRIQHKDSGWEHYVNKYDILDVDGHVLATRTLWHPHEHEQPFTRSLGGLVLVEEKEVFVRANDSVDGFSKLYKVVLPK